MEQRKCTVVPAEVCAPTGFGRANSVRVSRPRETLNARHTVKCPLRPEPRASADVDVPRPLFSRHARAYFKVIFNGWHFNEIVYRRNVDGKSTPIMAVVAMMYWSAARSPITGGRRGVTIVPYFSR